ncbi:MAG: recombination mediator RecR [Planctomycetes bacterium]|nr:recombination mediator RecR [Planctomycetota bacterium]
MSTESIEPLGNLKSEFQKLPGIGPRSAERLAFHVLRESRAAAAALAQAILEVKDKIVHCRTCFNLTAADPCPICRDPNRNHSEIWVVEQPKDVMILEDTGLVHGTYHVLMGHIAPLEGVEPDDLTIDALVERARSDSIREVVLALNPTLDGDGTTLHIQTLLRDLNVRVTRPARGLAVGSQLEYATPGMLESAIRGRAPV